MGIRYWLKGDEWRGQGGSLGDFIENPRLIEVCAPRSISELKYSSRGIVGYERFIFDCHIKKSDPSAR